MSVNREAAQQVDVKVLAEDTDLIRQIKNSREDRQAGRVFDQESGLDYLRMKVEELERGQSL